MSSAAPALLSAIPATTEPTVAGAAAATAAATDYRTLYASMKAPELFSAWNTEKNPKARTELMFSISQRKEPGLYPSGPIAAREREAGLYPDPADPQFGARLFEKREFYEARAVAAGVAAGTVDPCASAAAEKLFELTPVQRIVSRFMHPMTPYYGLLLFHGVGVGKTCSAVTIAEQYLDVSPGKKVIVLVPQALQDNFKRTVFDMSKVRWDAAAGRWTGQQCTGLSYIERLGLLTNPDEREVSYRIEEDRRARYTISGYQAFANWIERTLKAAVPAGLTDKVARQAAENEVLRRLFSDTLVIVDEAHNLRDTGADAVAEEEAEEGGTTEGGAAVGEAVENAGGKALNPYLRRIVLNAESLRLVLMTATPMYNSAPEIVLLLNYLIMNDTKKESNNLKVDVLFDKHGNLRDEVAAAALARAARAYVSYMRGENPYTFPLRMRPAAASPSPATEWPEISATKKPVTLQDVSSALNVLPLVFTEPVPGSPVDIALRGATVRTAVLGGAAGGAAAEEEEVVTGPSRDTMLDLRMQMANITYPNQMFGGGGWDNYFVGAKTDFDRRKIMTFTPRDQEDGPFAVDSVFTGKGLQACAPKMARIVESIRKARGICFAYSRYIKAGALPLAIALERAGFQRRMANGQLAPLLVGVTPVAPICALCGEAHATTAKADHPFRPATYVLITSDDDISPLASGLVRQAANWPEDPEWGPLGGNVKVVIGSQVASEGLDLKCIREVHVMDAWYHLNRTEQIIGRAIRYCSHSALRAVEKREGQPAMAYNNCLIYLHAVRGGAIGGDASTAFETAGAAVGDKVAPAKSSVAFETADMYAYRIAIAKALRVGRVQRLLKANAWDCNLELEAITFVGLPKRKQIDAQGRPLPDYDINDQDYTTYCDFQKCRHDCAVAVARTPADGLRLNASTYGVTDARRTLLERQDAVRHLFDEQIIIPETVVQELYSDLPGEIASEALMELLDQRRFRLRRPDGVEGYLLKRAGYLVFQPLAVTNTDIPIALRYARAFQLHRLFMDPVGPVFRREAEERPVAATGGAGTGGAAAGAAAGDISTLAPIPEVTKDTTKIQSYLTKWSVFVETGNPEKFPSYLSNTARIWSWILKHFGSVAAVKPVAYRWWMDHVPTYAEKKGLLELVVNSPPTAAGEKLSQTMKALQKATADDIFQNKSVAAYRLFNPATSSVEYYCRRGDAPAGAPFAACSSEFQKVLTAQMKGKAAEIPADIAPLTGFMVPKSGNIVFKTLDMAKIAGAKRQSYVGAECGNVSNLGEHHPRVRILHEAARSIAELEPHIIPDGEDDWDPEGKGVGEIAHMKDITHQPLCVYMEFLTRLLDQQQLGGKRWFLSPVESALSGLKGKK